MRILMVLSTKKYPPDRRVEREAQALIEGGHEVLLIARRGPKQARVEIVDGVRVVRTFLPFQNVKAVADLIYFTIQRFAILGTLVRVCRQHRVDVIHVHDLPYAFASIICAKLLGISSVFDMHEHYTEMLRMGFQTKSYRKLKFFGVILLELLKIEERLACRWASRVIVVDPEHRSRIVSLGTLSKNIAIITNTEDFEYFSSLPVLEGVLSEYNGYFVLLYTGGFSAHRGLKTTIDAMPRILETVPNTHLVLVGDGEERKELEAVVQERGLESHVTFTGFVPFESLPTYIRACDVGLIPHISTPHIETTMPNKIFQFMTLGKPVVVSSTRPMMRVVHEVRCGLIFEESNPVSLANNILKMQDPELRNRLGENGKVAASGQYNWQCTKQALLELYKSLGSHDS